MKIYKCLKIHSTMTFNSFYFVSRDNDLLVDIRKAIEEDINNLCAYAEKAQSGYKTQSGFELLYFDDMYESVDEYDIENGHKVITNDGKAYIIDKMLTWISRF